MRISDWSSDVCSSDLAQMPPGKDKPSRTLLTTMREIDRVGPSLRAFDSLLALDGPDYPIADPEPSDSAAALGEQDDAADEEQQIGRGLHAKLLFWRTGRSRTLRSEEHKSELQSLMRISYAVFCLTKKKMKKDS